MARSASPFLACLLLAIIWNEAPAFTPTEIHARAVRSVLVLEGRDSSGESLILASAIALGKGTAATQCDLLGQADKWVLIQTGREYEALPRERDDERNLCRLDVPGLAAPHPDIAPRDRVRVGQRVYAVGNALGLGLSLSEGLVSGIRDINGEAWIQTTAALAPGSEGGALFDEDGYLLGLTDYRKRDGQNINFAAPAAWLAEIATRASHAGKTGDMAPRAARLAREQNWKELAETASQWSRLQPGRSEPWHWLGAAREGLGDLRAATEALEAALARAPASVAINLDLARNRLKQDQADQALEGVRAVLEHHREDAGLWFAKGVAELALGRRDDAESSFQETVRLDGWHAPGWTVLNELALEKGNIRGALGAATQLTRIEPTRTEFWLRRAQAELRLGRPARALAATDRATALTPENGDVLYWRGAALAALGRPSQAIHILKRAIAAQPTRPAWAWQKLGNVYYGLYQFPDAIAAMREASRLAPDNATFRAELGIALKDGGQDDEALALFLDQRDKHPKDPLPWRQIGFIQIKLGKYPEAIAALEESLRLVPDQAQVWHALGQAYANTDRREDVRRVYQRLLALDSGRAETLYKTYIFPLETPP